MLNERAKELIKMRDEFTAFYDTVSKKLSNDETINEVMELRGYTDIRMFNLLKEIGVFKVDSMSDILLFCTTVTDESIKKWGLLNASGDFLLRGRYVVPVRDISGRVCALIGWYPDSRKYITTPTYGFSKDTLFFNMDCYSRAVVKGYCFLVEGIFDSLAIKSLGEPVLGNMGLPLSKIKTYILSRYGDKTICIPDNDSAGMSCSPYTSKLSGKNPKKNIWNIVGDKVFVVLPKGVKDMDDFIKEFDTADDIEKCKQSNMLLKLKED